MDFKPKLRKVTTYYQMEKIYQDDIEILNICLPNGRAPRFTKETLLLLKPHIDSYPLIVGDFHTLLLPTKN